MYKEFILSTVGSEGKLLLKFPTVPVLEKSKM